MQGPINKFWLIKTYGAILRANAVDPNALSCNEIVAALQRIGVKIYK
jgi:hypothetical protein